MSNQIIVLGIVVSLIFTEFTGLSPSGLITTGYIALALHTPTRILYTFFISILVYGTLRLLENVMIIYGRRRFALAIVLAFGIDFMLSAVRIMPVNPGLIGVIVPGLLANEWTRQGFLKSIFSLAITVGITVLIMLFNNIPVF